MKVIFCRFLLISLILFSGSAAYAQETPQQIAAPEIKAVDEYGVDLHSLSPLPSQPVFNIGTMEYVAIIDSASISEVPRDVSARDNFSGQLASVNDTNSENSCHRLVSVGQKSWRFCSLGTGPLSTFRPAYPNGTSLSEVSDEVFVFVGKNGMQATFISSSTAYAPHILSELKYPDGKQFKINYATINGLEKKSTVLSNDGYALKYIYNADATLSRVVGYNQAVDYCDPTGPDCVFSRQWPETQFSKTSVDNSVWPKLDVLTHYSITHPDGGVSKVVWRRYHPHGLADPLLGGRPYLVNWTPNSMQGSPGIQYNTCFSKVVSDDCTVDGTVFNCEEIGCLNPVSPLQCDSQSCDLQAIDGQVISATVAGREAHYLKGFDYSYPPTPRVRVRRSLAHYTNRGIKMATVGSVAPVGSDEEGDPYSDEPPCDDGSGSSGSSSGNNDEEEPDDDDDEECEVPEDYGEERLWVSYTDQFGRQSFTRRTRPEWLQLGPDSNDGRVDYTTDDRGNITEKIQQGRNGSAATIVERAGYDLDCNAPEKCNRPNWVEDALGNRTEYTYMPGTGLITRVRSPAVNGIRPEKRYTYEKRYASVKGASGGFTTITDGIWLLTKESTCIAGTSTDTGCVSSNDEVVTEFEYGGTASPNNLHPTVKKVTSGGTTLQTCSRYDELGRVISEIPANVADTSC